MRYHGRHDIRKSRGRRKAVAKGFHSAFENTAASKLTRHKIAFKYEPFKLKYFYEAPKNYTCVEDEDHKVLEWHEYTPDFLVFDKIIIETKGEFPHKDRKKMIAVKKQYPEYKIVLVFQNSANKVSPKGLTYAKWAEKNGFYYCNLTWLVPYINDLKKKL